MFFCEFSEISHKIFFKNPSGRLLLHKHSFCLLSQHDLVPVQKRCYTYFPVEYFLGIFCALGTRVSSIFQILTEKPIFNLLEHLWWSVFAKIDSSLKRLSIFTKEFSWRRMVKTNILVLTKTPWRFLLKTKTKDVFKTSSKRLHQDECLVGLFSAVLQQKGLLSSQNPLLNQKSNHKMKL